MVRTCLNIATANDNLLFGGARAEKMWALGYDFTEISKAYCTVYEIPLHVTAQTLYSTVSDSRQEKESHFK
jgi:hypothetical protein